MYQFFQYFFLANQKQQNYNNKKNFNRKNSSSQFSSDQQKDRMEIMADRSLKMQKQEQKSHIKISKNKSLSSPSNKPVTFKKQKSKGVDKTSHKVTYKQQKSTQSSQVKHKQQKSDKQKKFSNGSLSTNYTKYHAKSKKPKISRKMLEQKLLQKSNVTQKSQKSNQFLVLGEQLYDYEDMSKISTKHYKPMRKEPGQKYQNAKTQQVKPSENKKVTFSYYQNQQGNNNILLTNKNSTANSHYNSFSIFDQNKLTKKLSNTIKKIQRYIHGFIEFQEFEYFKAHLLANTQNLTLSKKMELYQTLLTDNQLLKQLQNQNKNQQLEQVDNVIKLSIQKVEKKSQKLSQIYQDQKLLIAKWKNSKLHQLEMAKKILQKMIEQGNLNEYNQRKRWDSEMSQQSSASQFEMLDQANNPLLLLQKQLELIMSEDYYPQMKKQTLNLRKSLNQLLKNQHYPEPKVESQAQITERNKMQDTKNYFTPNGVLWFFEQYFSFITEKPHYIEQIVEKLNEGFGYDYQTKKLISRTEDVLNWFSFSKDINNREVLDKDTFYEFQEKIIKVDPQINDQIFMYMHGFNVAIIDCFNEEFHRYRPFYPYGEPIPFVEKPGKYFEITQDSIFYFFQKCKFHVYSNYITFFAGLILSQKQQETYETRRYNIGKQVKLVNQQIQYDWEYYHFLKPVAKLSVFQQLYKDIQQELLRQIQSQIQRFSSVKK